MAQHSGSDSLAGSLLVSTAAIDGPEFSRSIVFLLDADDDGALGVVLNRPTEIPVIGVLDDWADRVTPPAVLFRGGPVEPQGAIGLALLQPGATEPSGWRRMTGSIGLIDLDEPVGEGLAGLRVYAGYAGWGAGQLEQEIAEGAWLVVPAEPSDLLADDPEGLWRGVLTRQPRPDSFLLTLPVDPSQN